LEWARRETAKVDRIARPRLANKSVNPGLKRALSRTPTIIVVLVVVVSGAVAGYRIYIGGQRNEPTSASQSTSSFTNSSSLIASLAYAHWMAIGEKNLTRIMSQYSTGYRAASFFISNSSLGPQNGRYDCNIPTGPNNCNRFLESAWQTLFNHTSSLKYSVCNYSMTTGSGGGDLVVATVWYQLRNMNQTLKVPYMINFEYYNSTWAVDKEWFGMQEDQAILFPGYIIPSC
jgi:hypothetical protein